MSLAQGVPGSIGGIVTDPSGGVLVGVKVRITNSETGRVFERATNQQGAYLVPQLLPGVYEVRAELAEFKQTQVERVQVDID
jgi:hypothetical protein